MLKLNEHIKLIFFYAIILLQHSYNVECGSPIIIEHPEDIIVAKNEPVTLRCEAEGNPQPEISWYKDGKLVPTAINGHNTHRLLLPSGSLFFLRAVYSRKEDDGGVYFCQAENSQGMTRSKNATLTVAVLRDKFRLEPEDQGVERGGVARFICSPPKGMPTPTVFWKKNGKFIDLEKEERLHLDGEGDLVIEKVSDEDEGKYQCLAKNIVGTRSTDKAELFVQVKPFIIKHPENISIVAGEEIRLGCVVGGRPPPEIRWWRQNGQLPANRVLVSDNSVLTVRNVIPDDEDVYVCQAENNVGSVQALANVQIHSPPIFLVEPTDQKVAEGAPAVLDCIAAGNPTPTLFWMKESDSNILLPGSTTSHVTVTPEGTLRIVSVSADTDAGWYSCAAVSESGSCLSRAEVAVARDSDRPPPILQLGPVNQTLPMGSTGSLPCQATSHETSIKWLKDGVPFDFQEERIQLDDENTLTIKELSLSDSGLYTCQARSPSGQAVWSASLTVADPSDGTIQFKSMPYFSQFPASPSMPVFVNASSTSITVAWDKPHRIGGSSLKGYQLDYYTLATPSHWLTVQDVRQEVFTLTKLPPLTTVLVLVRAVNDHGLSPPSPVSKPMKTTTKVGPDGGKDDFSSNKGLDKNPAFIRLRLAQRVLELQEAVAVTSRKVKLQWELLTSKLYIEGYHIHIRDLTSREPTYDVVTISGGATRSHTLSDLRPHTRYSIFIIPYNKKIKGRPSNMKIALTKEDVPTASPENFEAQQVNASTVLLQWSSPLKRELHGDLKGYKINVEIEHQGNESKVVEFNNFTLEPEVTSLILHNLSSTAKYTFRVAAYNRQGIGPFTQNLAMKMNSLISPTILEPPTFADQAHSAHEVEAAGDATEVGGIDLIVQEIWFVSLMALMVLIILVAFVATVWVRRQRSHIKNLGHYNVPVHKVDDITHVNFTDRDHLWFDPNWTKGNADHSEKANEDPMAAMLENNCKNRNATNIFINKLAQLNNAAPEYAEVDGMKGLPGLPGLPGNLAANASTKRIMQTSNQQGPYATTTLVEPSNSNGSSAHHSNTSTGTSMANGNVLTPTPLRSNSMGKTVNNTNSNKSSPNNNNNRSSNHDETDTPSGVNGLSDKEQNLASMTSSSSGSTSSKRLREPSQPPPPLPPPPAESLMINYFSSPQSNPGTRNANSGRQSSISDARLYNRSQMNGSGHEGVNSSSPPPAPPARGLSSYNGVRTGSFASFGHIYPQDPRLFGTPMQQANGFNQSHYSVPGMFYHHPHPAMLPGCCPGGMLPNTGASMSGSQTEDQYESASVCYGQSGQAMVNGHAMVAPMWVSHQNGGQAMCNMAVPIPSQCSTGFEDHELETDCCEDQGWEWDSCGSGEEDDDAADGHGCDEVEEESFYAGSEFGDRALSNSRRSNPTQQDENEKKMSEKISLNQAKRRLSNKSIHSNTEEEHNGKNRQISQSAQATPVCGRRKKSQPRPSSVCSTDSNFSSVSTHYHHMAGYDPATGQPQFSNGRVGYGHRRQHRLHQRRNHVGVEKLSNNKPVSEGSEKIYSTFKPPVAQSPAPPATPDRNKPTEIHSQSGMDKSSQKRGQSDESRLSPPQLQSSKDQNTSNKSQTEPSHMKIDSGNKTGSQNHSEDESALFAQVSQDMSEMVHHLNSIQHDISELAGRPISLYDNT